MRPGPSLVRIAALTAFAGVLAFAGRAEAQLGTGGTGILTGTGGTTGSSSFTSSDFFMSLQGTEGVNLTTSDLPRFFNKARCDCATPVYLFVALESSGAAKRSNITSTTATMRFYLGGNCPADVELGFTGSTTNCTLIDTESLTTFFSHGNVTVPTDARTLSQNVDLGTGDASTGACSSAFTQTITMFLDVNGDNVPDYSQAIQATIDTIPPPQPAGVTIQSGNEAIILNWTAIDTSITSDLLGYQILCSRADAYQVFKAGTYGTIFQSCTSPSADGGVINGAIDGGLEDLNSLYVCSPQLSAFTTSHRVDILQNGITYAAAVVAVDNSGNASSPLPVLYAKPEKTLSFYDVYRNGMMDQTANNNVNAPGGASGGYCAVGSARPRLTSTLAALAAFLLGGLGLTVARRRRGGRR